MKFQDYFSLISKSVAETGYDNFFPSACVSKIWKDKFHVLDIELTEKGEEKVAVSWAQSLDNSSNTIFFAFRAGERRVTVVEMKEKNIIDAQVIYVFPYSESEEKKKQNIYGEQGTGADSP